MKTIKFQTTAWLTSFRAERNADLTDGDNLNFSSFDMADQGWIKVGEAGISVTLRDPNEITASQVAVLREAKRRLQAETEMKVNAIEGQIQSLLAIENKSCATTEG